MAVSVIGVCAGAHVGIKPSRARCGSCAHDLIPKYDAAAAVGCYGTEL